MRKFLSFLSLIVKNETNNQGMSKNINNWSFFIGWAANYC